MRSRALSAITVLLVTVAGLAVAAPADAAGGLPANPSSRYHLVVPRQLAFEHGTGFAAGVTVTIPIVPPSQPDALPADTSAVLVEVDLGYNGLGGILMANDCSRPPDPAVDGIGRVYDDIKVVPQTVFQTAIPVRDRQFCVTAQGDFHAYFSLLGYVDGAPDGLVYTDVADVNLYDGAPPTGQLVLDLPPADGYAFKVAIAGRHDATGGYALSALNLWRCSGFEQIALGVGLTEPNDELALSGSLILVRGGAPLCISFFGLGTRLSVTLAGTYSLTGVPSAAAPPLIRYRPQKAPFFTALEPVRVLDTRESPGERVDAGTSYVVDLTGSVPQGAAAASLNVTVTAPIGPGYVTVYPCGVDVPLASNVNYTTGQTIPNAVTVALGSGATVCLYTSAAAHLIVDLSGYFDDGGGAGYESIPPTRAFDTRQSGPRRPAGSTWEADLSAFVPADATAVVMNVTVTEPLLDGFVTVHPCGSERPIVSNLNVVPGATAANLVTVKLPPDKRVCFYTHVPAHLVADVAGSYSTGGTAGLVALTPDRLFDTREETSGRQPAGSTGFVTFVRDATAWLMNVTVTDASGPGFVTTFPCDGDRPQASNVNYVRGQTVANLALVRPAADRRVCFYTHGATHLVADLAGFFTPQFFTVAYRPDGTDVA